MTSDLAKDWNVADVQVPLAKTIAEATKLWPKITVDPAAFARFVAQRLPGKQEATNALQSERGVDLLLAFACAQEDAHALAAFEARYQRHVDTVLASMTKHDFSRSEVKQALRQHLFLRREDAPLRIAKYAGRGSLLAFVRAVVLRLALNTLRARRPDKEEGDLDSLIETSSDALAGYMSELYASECKVAFRSALEKLEPRTRTLLRYHVIDQLSIDQIGTIYHVHRVTAARWVQAARDTMIQVTRKILMSSLEVDRSELDSILRTVGSDLDVSAERLLRATQS